MKKLYLSLVIILMCYASTFAQEKKDSEPYKNWEVGINAGVDNFTGGYNMYSKSRWNHFNHWKSVLDPGFGVLVKRNFSHVFALEGSWNYTSLTGKWNEAGSNPNFRTRVSEFDLNTVWNLTNLFSKNKFDRKIFWYAKLGIGESYLNNIVSMSAAASGPDWKKAAWKPGYDLGTGVAFRLTDNVKLNVGTQWSWISTDRLDGKSEYPGITMKPGSNVPNVFETKLYTHVGLSYTFGKKKKPAPVPVIVPEVKPEPKPAPVPEVKPEPKPEPAPEPKPVTPAVVGNVYTIKFGLNFAFDKWNLDKQSTAELDRLVKDMIDNPTVDVEISSHTDSRGSASYNMTLSEKRGKAVSDYLVGKGINASRIKSFAFGETQLLNKCADGVPCTPAEHAVNRRAVATIVIRK
jgi:outer membrane protein OmpA-like peptidoglycan-associated protein